MNDDNFDDVLNMANGWFKHRPCTHENIRVFIGKMKDILVFDEEKMWHEIYSTHAVHVVGSHSVLEDSGDHEDWLNTTTFEVKNRDVEWHYWGHYKDYISSKGLPKEVANELDEVTTNILSKLEDPMRKGHWDRRGLVMGSVQSGKTGNYTGLIAKAIDAGYKMVIILTGVHNSLRSQTQLRINEELLGYDLEKAQRLEDIEFSKIGVGKLFPKHGELNNGEKKPIQTLTTGDEKGDFKKQIATRVGFVSSVPHVLVIKKHVSILKNLVDWVGMAAGVEDEEGRIRVTDVPLLVIDDECDQASVNTKKEIRDPDTGLVKEDCDPTKTNQRIRELLSTFDKSAYIGYTATPYANIFIHHNQPHPKYGDNLFPRNFIFNLTQPDNYVGASKIFGIKDGDSGENEPLPILGMPIDDTEEIIPRKHDKNLIINKLPDSMKKAIKEFLLVCAAKRERKIRNPHNSMLIHVTRFTNVQNRIHDLVTQEIRRLLARISSSNDPLDDFKKIWEEEFVPVSEQMKTMGENIQCNEWDDIAKHLPIMARMVEVKAINGSSKDALLYKEVEDRTQKKLRGGESVEWENKGCHVIAIGGDKLSRGLTLEGLSVTYYLRPSSMYDTLMQMGRWFGYRPGYLDLCRINTTKEIIEFFQQIAKAEIMLREQFDHMAFVGMEPEDFGLAVEVDPGMLMITNSGKRRHTELVSQSFSGRISETVNFDLKYISHNNKVLNNLIHECEKYGKKQHIVTDPREYRWKGLKKGIVSKFLSDFIGSKEAYLVRPKIMSKFIEEQIGNDLSTWDVTILNNKSSPYSIKIGEFSFGCWHRKANSKVENNLSIGRLVSNADEWLDFTDDERKDCIQEYRKKKKENEGKDPGDKRPPGTFIRYSRPMERGHLFIYPIYADTPEDQKDLLYGMSSNDGVFGFAISWPSDENSSHRFKKSTVRANSVYVEQFWE